MPLLTIAIPTVNRPALVGRAIASALAQTHADVEVVVSNNGTCADTRALLDAQTDPRLRLVHHGRTMGVIPHGKFIFSQVRTPYVVFLSDDDYLAPTFAARTLDAYAHDPQLAFVHTRVQFESPAATFASRPHPAVVEGWRLVADFLRGGHGPAHCATVYRAGEARDAFSRVPDECIVGDLFLWPTLAMRGRVGYLDEPLSHYTWHGENMTTGIPLSRWVRDYSLARAEWEGAAERAGLSEAARAQLRAAADGHLPRLALAHLWLRAQSGAGKGELVRDLVAHRALLTVHPARAAVRAMAMLALPGSALRAMHRARLASAPG